MRDCILVLGMHRSGTSAITGALKLLGADLGSLEEAPLSEQNPHGFFEHSEIVACHERLLHRLGYTWDDPRRVTPSQLEGRQATPFRRQLTDILSREFGASRFWAVKDPRLCRLLPLWIPILEELGTRARFVIIHRHPEEVAASLGRRNGFSPEKSGFLWLDHNLCAEHYSRGAARVFVAFERLLAEPRAVLEEIGAALDLEWPVAWSEAVADLRRFLRPELRHFSVAGGCDGMDFGRVRELVQGLYRALGAGEPWAGDGDSERFDRIGSGYLAIAGALDPLLLEHMAQLTWGRTGIAKTQQEVAFHLRRQQDDLERYREKLEGVWEHLEERAAWLGAMDEKVKRMENRVGHLENLSEMVWSSKLWRGYLGMARLGQRAAQAVARLLGRPRAEKTPDQSM